MRWIAGFGAVLFSACSGGEPPAVAVATVDTLPGGGVHVVSRSEGAWAIRGEEPWQLVEQVRIGAVEGAGPDVFGSVSGILPDPMGRTWVLDYQAHELRQFDQDGTHIRTVGGEGEGPGEFGFNPCAFPAPNGDVMVEAGGRWQWFDTAGVLVASQPATRTFSCAVLEWTTDGRLLAATSVRSPSAPGPTYAYIDHVVDADGRLVARDTFPSPVVPESPRVRWLRPDGRPIITNYVPFSHRAVAFMGPEGDMWITEGGGDYRIRRQSLTGDTILIIERPYEPVPIPDSIRAAEIEGLYRDDYRLDPDFDLDDVPRVYPPFDRYTIGDDGTLWVRRHVEGGVEGLDVFAPDGTYLGPVGVPTDFASMDLYHAITSDHIYATFTDDLGVEYAVRLAIRKPNG